jgi:tetratricopeptide (TPR) repeat protein
MMRALGIAALVGMALVCSAVSTAAQMELGVVKGRVVDEAGQPLPGVTIRLVNLDRGREVTLTTDKDGRFYRRGLQAVEYELTVQREGFQPVNDKVKLTAGTDRNFDFTLAKAAAGGSKEFQDGVAAYTAGNFALAASRFEAAIAQAPTVAPLHVNLALAYFQLKRPADAVASLEKGAALAPTDAAIHYQLGSAYVDTQAYDKAVAALEKGLSATPDLAKDPLAAEAASTLGAVYFAQGKVAEAEAQFGMAKVVFSKGDAAGALELFEQVVTAHPGTPEAAQAATFIKELKKGNR